MYGFLTPIHTTFFLPCKPEYTFEPFDFLYYRPLLIFLLSVLLHFQVPYFFFFYCSLLLVLFVACVSVAHQDNFTEFLHFSAFANTLVTFFPLSLTSATTYRLTIIHILQISLSFTPDNSLMTNLLSPAFSHTQFNSPSISLLYDIPLTTHSAFLPS